MTKVNYLLMVGLAFAAIQVATVEAADVSCKALADGSLPPHCTKNTPIVTGDHPPMGATGQHPAPVATQNGSLPAMDSSAVPIGEGGDGKGPAAVDMKGAMINDGGFGANSGADAEAAKAAKAEAIVKCVKDFTDSGMGKKNAKDICEEKAQQRMIKETN